VDLEIVVGAVESGLWKFPQLHYPAKVHGNFRFEGR